ncbi:MAG: hypothetical protein RDV48_22065 [Candidatus Eremiobacteraeota bacterium]|nr:hypothetical protein [Candidatus Eremiobacteraeota bacterium]
MAEAEDRRREIKRVIEAYKERNQATPRADVTIAPCLSKGKTPPFA